MQRTTARAVFLLASALTGFSTAASSVPATEIARFHLADAPTKADDVKARSAPASNPDPLTAALAKPILGRGDVMAALSRYCLDRLPAAPNPASTAEWQAESERIRKRVLREVVFRGRAAAWRDAPARVEWQGTIPGGPGYCIRKLRYEALPGMWIPALVYMPDGIEGKIGEVPAVLNFHGHVGGPGKAYVPKQIRCINLAKRGLIAMSTGWFATGQLVHQDYLHNRAPQLDLCGAAGLAPFHLLMTRALDILLSIEQVDSRRVAVTGLSGGGWQTIMLGSLDRRPTLVAPVAGHAAFAMRVEHPLSLGDYEQMPCDLAEWCDYSHLTAMVAPRPLLLTYNIKDNCCFQADQALGSLLATTLPVYRLHGKPRFCRWHVNYDPGTHNYERDNREAFYRMVDEFLFTGDDRMETVEIPCESEVKKFEELVVDLPERNATFQALAKQLMADLPRDLTPPDDVVGRHAWVKQRRDALRSVTRYAELPVEGELVEEPTNAGEKAGESATVGLLSVRSGHTTATIRRWRLLLGPYWTVPAVEITPPGKPVETVLLAADKGRSATSDRVAELLGQGKRVLVFDLLLIGEQTPESHGSLFAMLAQSTGGRIVGIQAAQIAAVARWTRLRYPSPVRLETCGPRTSLSALVATVLDPRLVDGLQTRESLESLKDVIRNNWTFEQMPEAFCFGLLEVVDIEQLRRLAEGP
ncbi:MAG TPA: hypothetical protein DD670_04660 [Planctomycetaceae bacterium]|nr:hypothetical protein [Planctomycetaceae bacterium]